MTIRRALLVGNDEYDNAPPFAPLAACVDDAERLSSLLEKHEDGSDNFTVKKLVSTETSITEASLHQEIKKFFNPEGAARAEVLCFFYAGHGAYDEFEESGYLVAQDGKDGNLGIPMEKLIGYANRANAEHVLIILDCCHAGAVDKSFATGGLASPGEGVCIMAATRDKEQAVEVGDGGVFSSLLAGALAGGGADPVTGEVSVANLHAYVDGALGAHDQCPQFKSNISNWCVVRKTQPQVAPEVVKSIVQIFPEPNEPLALDHTFEPTLDPTGHENEAVFSMLQDMRDASLVEVVGEKHMYYAAKHKKSCRLTPLGKYYWMLVKRNRFN